MASPARCQRTGKVATFLTGRGMARGRCTFRQRDLTAAIRAAVAAGCQVAKAEIDADGKIVVVMRPEESDAEAIAPVKQIVM